MSQGSNSSRIGMARQKVRFNDAGFIVERNGNPKSRRNPNGANKEALRHQRQDRYM